MKPSLPPGALLLFAAGFFLGVGRLPGQTPAPKPASSEVVEMSPFEVPAESNRGYIASETMTGTRAKTQIIDLPYSVNILTSEFFEDFGIFELSDNVTQISGFTGLDVGGNFSLRGFISTNQLRDGFFRLGRYGSSNIDSMEIIKGSSAAIYGRTSPGGMMNMISKKPRGTASQKLSVNLGDYDTKRYTLETTGPLFSEKLGKTNYVLTASVYERGYDVDYALMRNLEYYFAADHVFANGSKLFVSAESFDQTRKSPVAPAPLVVDQKGTTATTDDVAVGYALTLGKVSAYGPNSQLNRGNTSLTATYEKTISSVFSARISGNYYLARRDDYNQNMSWGTVNINRPGGVASTVTRGNATATNNAFVPSWGRIIEDGGAFQADVLAHYWTNDRAIEHRTLVTIDFNDYYRWDPTIGTMGPTNPLAVAWNQVRTVTLDAQLRPVGPIAYFPVWHDAVNGYVSTRKFRRRTTAFGGNVREQAILFNGRLLASAGARFDYFRWRHRDFSTAASTFTPFVPGYKPGDLIRKTISQVKPNVGVNFKVREDFRLFANYSESYFVAQGDNPIEIVNPTYKPESAAGWDYGFKGALLDNRLSYTVSGYYIDRHNVTVDDIDPITFTAVSRRDGDQLVRGYEVDLTWQMTKEFSFVGSYGDVHSRYTDFGTANPQAVGRGVQYVSPYNGSLSVKYAPGRGALQGFSANVGVTFVGATPTETPIAGDVVVTQAGTGQRIVTSSTGQWKLKAPSYNLWSAGVRYTLGGTSKYSHTFALNVQNALDKDYFKPGSGGASRILLGDRRSLFFTYTLGHKGATF